jgi:hypothetical protein
LNCSPGRLRRRVAKGVRGGKSKTVLDAERALSRQAEAAYVFSKLEEVP